MTTDEMRMLIDEAAQTLRTVRAALVDCDFRELARTLATTVGALEEVSNALKEDEDYEI